MFSGGPTPGQSGQPAAQGILGILFLGSALLAVFILIMLVFFVKSYHADRMRAAAFDAAPNCRATVSSGAKGAPCTIEWANVLDRYYTSSNTSRQSSSYHYHLLLRSGYGERRSVEIENANLFWHTERGAALKLQRWGDRTTAVQLVSGESSPTTENPDWQLSNLLRGLVALTIAECVMVVAAIATWTGLRRIGA